MAYDGDRLHPHVPPTALKDESQNLLYASPPGPSEKTMQPLHRPLTSRILFIGGLIITLLCGLILALLSYLCIAFQCSTSGRFVISSAPLGKVLTLSQVASHSAPLMLPIAMKLCSYGLAATWMKNSEKALVRDLPSPLQYGLLLLVCANANIVALAIALIYILKAGGQHTLRSPAILRKSIALLATLVVSSYVITASDVWLHASSSAISIYSTSPLTDVRTGRPATGLAFGRSINSTKCNSIQADPENSSFYKDSCGQLSGGSGGDGVTAMEGLRVLSNSSNFNQVVYTDNKISIVVPADLPTNTTYTASTVGVGAQCRSITRECIDPNDFGPEAALNVKCGGPTIFNATAAFAQGALDDNGNGIFGYEVTSNPFHVGAVVTSEAYFDENNPGGGYHEFRNGTGWFRHGNSGFWNVVYCDLTTFDVVYTFSSLTSAFRAVSFEPTPLEVTRYVSTFEFESIPGFAGTTVPLEALVLRSIVDGAGLRTDTTYEEAYALELARQTISRSATLYIGADPQEAKSERIIIGSQLDLIPLCLMLGMMALYSVFVLFILIRTLVAARRAPFLQLASAQLTDPLVIIHGLYGPKAPIHTWEPDAQKRFGRETDGDRLMIGGWQNGDVHDAGDYTASWFGVTKVDQAHG